MCEECKSLVFTLIRLEALSCSQTAAGHEVTDSMCVYALNRTAVFSFNLASSVYRHNSE